MPKSFTVRIADNKTIVDKIIVGVPVNTSSTSGGGGSGGSGSTDAESIVGYTVNVAGRDHDSILMFNEDTEQWVAKNTLNNHVIDGGDY